MRGEKLSSGAHTADFRASSVRSSSGQKFQGCPPQNAVAPEMRPYLVRSTKTPRVHRDLRAILIPSKTCLGELLRRRVKCLAKEVVESKEPIFIFRQALGRFWIRS
jgi:hypothetical protein